MVQYQNFTMTSFYLLPDCGGPAPPRLNLAYTALDPAANISATTYFTTKLPFCPLTWTLANIYPASTFTLSGTIFTYSSNIVTIYATDNN